MTKRHFRNTLILVVATMANPCQGIEQQIKEKPETWFNSDNDTITNFLKEDTPVFLNNNLPERVLLSHNKIMLSKNSIETGWVKINQCYKNLDEIQKTQIVYQYKSMRDLQILSTSNIEKAWTEGQSVQLFNTQQNAALCISADVRIFNQNPDKSFSMLSGPYHRKVLDSYLPLHLIIEVSYPKDLLLYTGITPETQNLRPTFQPGKISIDTTYKGKLTLEIRFQKIILINK